MYSHSILLILPASFSLSPQMITSVRMTLTSVKRKTLCMRVTTYHILTMSPRRRGRKRTSVWGEGVFQNHGEHSQNSGNLDIHVRLSRLQCQSCYLVFVFIFVCLWHRNSTSFSTLELGPIMESQLIFFYTVLIFGKGQCCKTLM